MSIRKIKEQFLQQKFKKALELESETRTSTANKIHSVGILTTDEISSRFDILQHVDDVLKISRNVHIYSYRKFKKTDKKSYKHFTEKDMNWQGAVTDASLDVFLETPFDLLISFFDTKQLYLEFGTLKSKATFKVGFAGVNDKLFDLVIAEKSENVMSFMNEIYKYLDLLKKIEEKV
jgi:formylmethanofuran dehydrogenase subunit E-like metal-binding protein